MATTFSLFNRANAKIKAPRSQRHASPAGIWKIAVTLALWLLSYDVCLFCPKNPTDTAAPPLYFCSAFQLNPSTLPGEIVERQLMALKDDDMASVYKYASPGNKLQTGDVTKFSKMVRSGPYRYLVGHSRSEILMECKMGASWQFLVRVVSPAVSSDDGDEEPYSRDTTSRKVVEYWWSLSRCNAGEFPGSYMVDAVIPNQM